MLRPRCAKPHAWDHSSPSAHTRTAPEKDVRRATAAISVRRSATGCILPFHVLRSESIFQAVASLRGGDSMITKGVLSCLIAALGIGLLPTGAAAAVEATPTASVRITDRPAVLRPDGGVRLVIAARC